MNLTISIIYALTILNFIMNCFILYDVEKTIPKNISDHSVQMVFTKESKAWLSSEDGKKYFIETYDMNHGK